jgi:hypothetical protein
VSTYRSTRPRSQRRRAMWRKELRKRSRRSVSESEMVEVMGSLVFPMVLEVKLGASTVLLGKSVTVGAGVGTSEEVTDGVSLAKVKGSATPETAMEVEERAAEPVMVADSSMARIEVGAESGISVVEARASGSVVDGSAGAEEEDLTAEEVALAGSMGAVETRSAPLFTRRKRRGLDAHLSDCRVAVEHRVFPAGDLVS